MGDKSMIGLRFRFYWDMFKLGLIAIVSFLLIGIVLSIPLCLLWNWLMPNIFGLPTINILEALGLSAIVTLLNPKPLELQKNKVKPIDSDKLNKKEYVESKRIRSDIIFMNDDVVYYTGEMVGGRPHGKGYATNEESEWADAAFPATYDGQWLNGLPDGTGEFKQFKPNYYPPNGKIDEHYIGPFKNGEMGGKGKYLIYRHEDGKTKWRKVEYKNGKLISYKN